MQTNPFPRRSVYTLLIVIAVGMACAHIVSAQRVYEPSLHRTEGDAGDVRPLWPKTRPTPLPIYGSNDRSRWATVRALVDHGTFVIGRRDVRTLRASAVAPLGQLNPIAAAALFDAGYRARIASDSGIIFEDGWQSVDKVLDPNTMEYYSSKPPLLSVLIAGLYWLLKLVTGWTFTASYRGAATQGNEIIRALLLLVNGVPFAIYLWQLGRVVETWGRSDWGRLYVLAAAAFGTMVMTFLITLSNHTTGTFATMFAWLALLRVVNGGSAWYHFVTAGFFAAFAAACELPALAFTAAVLALLLWHCPRRTLAFAVPPALVVGAAFFAANYMALGTWRIAYAQTDSVWYQYEGSHWRKPAPEILPYKRGIDWARRSGQEDLAMYAVHVLVGHHGVFSMTPIWVLAFTGMVGGFAKATPQAAKATPQAAKATPQAAKATPQAAALPWFVQPLGLVLSIVVIGFYLYSSDNYGGWTNGLRWLMWLTPIWLTCLLPVADWLAERRWGRVLANALLAVSVFSASYEPWNPWRHPWLYDVMVEMGWRGY